jgi:tetratricopeptide (TPR) repeat protein
MDLVSRAAQWTQEVLNIYEPDSLWYERLGETYLALEEFDPALASFDKARNVNNSHWKLGEGFAQAYAGKKDFQAAIREIQPVLTTFRGQKVLEPNEKDEFVHDLLLVARWQEKLNNLENATSLYAEALEINPFDFRACFDMLKALRLAQNDSCARVFFAKTYEEKSGKNKFNRLANLLFFAAIDTEEAHSRFNTLTELTYRTESFEIIQKAFKDALEIAGESKDVYPQGYLLLYLGVVMARQASGAGAMKAALDCWGKTCGILKSTEWVDSYARYLAAQFLNSHHFQQAIDLWDGTKDPQIHPERLKEILNDSASGSARLSLDSSTFLGSYYLRTDQIHKTKDLYLNPMKEALDMLSDDDLENDSDGYAYLADILLHTGDDVNALSAWSLVTPHDCARFDDSRTPAPGSSQADSPTAELLDTIAPKTNNGDNTDVETRLADDLVNSDPGPNDGAMEPQKERTGDIYLECMGNCDKVWTFADDMWCCKYCPDTVFCRDCRQKVEDHKLERYWCHAGHDWLFVPPWSDEEFHRIGRGRVRIEGDIVNGKRIGGRIVKIKEWLNMIRTDWGIEIPEEWREEVPDGIERSDLKS